MYLRVLPGAAKPLESTHTITKRRGIMKDPFEVLQQKEQEMVRVKKEVDALRIVAQLLGDENNGHKTELRQATGTD